MLCRHEKRGSVLKKQETNIGGFKVWVVSIVSRIIRVSSKSRQHKFRVLEFKDGETKDYGIRTHCNIRRMSRTGRYA